MEINTIITLSTWKHFPGESCAAYRIALLGFEVSVTEFYAKQYEKDFIAFFADFLKGRVGMFISSDSIGDLLERRDLLPNVLTLGDYLGVWSVAGPQDSHNPTVRIIRAEA